jgi:uncharacterized protein (DUF2235 family)
MPKNIVICCDGTACQFAQANTNVIKLYYMLDQDQEKQLTYYHPGLGTMEPAGALTPWSRAITKLLGMAVGYGLSNDIRDVYSFLMEKYCADDRVFLFGFSRGAYTVRAVCSLLHLYGLIRSGNEPLIPYAVRMMMGIDRANSKNAAQEQKVKEYFDLAHGFHVTMSRIDCKPYFVGVWDTVSSVGWIANPLHLPFTADNPDIQYGRHAVSIDEHRAFFRDNLWRQNPSMKQHGPIDVKQVWFPGDHCDVGGGYAEAESGLSKIALEWMVEEAEAEGLYVDFNRKEEVLGRRPNNNPEHQYVRPNYDGPAHESLKGPWNLGEVVVKRRYDWNTQTWGHGMNLWQRRFIPPRSLVHESAFLRAGGYSKRLPPDAIRVPTYSAVELKAQNANSNKDQKEPTSNSMPVL